MKQILFSELSVKLFLFTKQRLKFPLNVNRFRYGTKNVWTHIVIWEVNWEVIEPLKVALLITCIPYYYSYPWLQPDYNLTTTPDYNLTTTWLLLDIYLDTFWKGKIHPSLPPFTFSPFKMEYWSTVLLSWHLKCNISPRLIPWSRTILSLNINVKSEICFCFRILNWTRIRIT